MPALREYAKECVGLFLYCILPSGPPLLWESQMDLENFQNISLEIITLSEILLNHASESG